MSDFVMTISSAENSEASDDEEIEIVSKEKEALFAFTDGATQKKAPPGVRAPDGTKRTPITQKINQQLAKRKDEGREVPEVHQEEDEEEEEEEEEIEDEPVEKEKPKKAKIDPNTSLVAQAKKHVANRKLNIDFSALKLSKPLLKAIKDIGFALPTPVQAETIPLALGGEDLLVNAVTGSGKTAAFALPILERLIYRPRRIPLTRVLILLPTRELAAQCLNMIEDLGRHTDIRVCLVAGGLALQTQETSLRAKPDIVVATPGRLIDHLRNSQSFHVEDIEILVLDEADRLLEMGFADEVKEIVKACPTQRQTMLFSATLSDQVQDLVNLSLKEPKLVAINAFSSIVDTLEQEFIRIRKNREEDREPIVISLCTRFFTNKTIVFIQSKAQAHRLMIIFGLLKLKAAELHGNLSQAQRLEALELFRTQQVDFLLCTDLAARGLDIQGVQTVINTSMPKEFRLYVHRVGRTARAGRSGRAITLVSDDQRKVLKEVMKRAPHAVKLRTVPQSTIVALRQKIESLQPDVEAILQEEKLEKAARMAEMEANKAGNMIKFKDSIHARPARTWFQTPQEKVATKEKAVRQFGETLPQPEEAKKKTKKTKEEKKEEKRLAEKEEKKKERDRDMHMVKMVVKKAKAAKKRKITLQNQPQDRLVVADPSELPAKSKKPRFEPKAKIDPRYKVFEKKKDEEEEKKPFRTKGRKAFKSKSRYKRR